MMGARSRRALPKRPTAAPTRGVIWLLWDSNANGNIGVLPQRALGDANVRCPCHLQRRELGMRMLTYCRQGEVRFGAAVGSAVVDLSGRMPRFTSLKSLLAADALAEAQDIVNGADADCPLSGIRWLPPVPDAGKIICIGVNYGNRNAEYGDAIPAPAYPSVFMRSRESLTGHLEPLVRPPESTQLDYEGEIALVIGRAGRRIPESRARKHIAGLTLVNEGSVRDWLRHSRFNVTPGKNFERSGAAGPWLVTKDA
ncbi:MAG: hypothetical protein F4Y55_04890, partial [Gammaproteobacteria bacterium]|nr:hypothetical protein [Gammaproteobacteria bacterium]